MRILILEPDEYYHPHFTESLGEVAEVLIEKSGAGVREAVQKHAPDVLIMELLLPGSDGYRVLEEISEMRSNRKLPVIIFSRADHLEDVQASINSGVTAYFVKGRDSVNDIKKLVLSLSN